MSTYSDWLGWGCVAHQGGHCATSPSLFLGPKDWWVHPACGMAGTQEVPSSLMVSELLSVDPADTRRTLVQQEIVGEAVTTPS